MYYNIISDINLNLVLHWLQIHSQTSSTDAILLPPDPSCVRSLMATWMYATPSSSLKTVTLSAPLSGDGVGVGDESLSSLASLSALVTSKLPFCQCRDPAENDQNYK